ncbi:MAG: di-trans,poly-cis-decaprenylcistransferase [Clostridia bacterium]|nr:di-trans,poly-cis-decaprenylcistransferase [Clostridia bacterium]
MHLSVIMDGGGRYAASKGLLRFNGYIFGTRAILDIIDASDENRVSHLSFYVSSKENLTRGIGEKLAISSVYVDFIQNTLLPICKTRGYKLFFVGDFEALTPELMSTIASANAQTINNRGMTIAFVFAYNGMQEVTDAFNQVFKQKLISGVLTPVTTQEVQQYMYSASLPPVDCLIRYGGAHRLSGFLPYSTAYAELFFLDKLFPDADKGDIYDIIKKYKKIKRKFGKI